MNNQIIQSQQQYDEYMVRKYEGYIEDGNLQIGDLDRGDPDIINLKFIETFNITALKICICCDMEVKLRNQTIKKLTLEKQKNQYQMILKVDDLELENLEVLYLQYNGLENNQFYNLVKFKKLNTLDVSNNKVDLTHIHIVTSLIKLSMCYCGLKNIDLISSLVILKDLDLSGNTDLDLSPLCKLQSLTKLSMNNCGLKHIDKINQFTTLETLNIAENQLQNIDSIRLLINLKELNISENEILDITPLKDLVSIIKLNLSVCGLTSLSALKPLINLQDLDLQGNSNINITELQQLKNLTHLQLMFCNLVSIYVLRPLVNLEELNISFNNIVYLDANLNDMTKLQQLNVQLNCVNDFSSLDLHQNYNENFDISDQRSYSEGELSLANLMRYIERPNIQLKFIQNKSQTALLNNCKQKINAIMNNTRVRQIQFTSSVVNLFHQLNQFGLE
ncbi:leucine-rich_repeat domain-containing protein [Hexamita inflata]|uniref:Leucine-rich repeat domain-containing protein n=1 Tax=Hexamita inflata TaxID=28002 RepID=A0AA86TD87_9EUKA|nr:leucine-rich repeat domain-containing protein [Hexamita inflata]